MVLRQGSSISANSISSEYKLSSSFPSSIHLPQNSVPSGSIVRIDANDITTTTGTSIGSLGGFSQSTASQCPTYFTENGFNNLPYLTFNRTNSQFLNGGAKTLNIASNGGFTAMVLARFTGSVGAWERIFHFGAGSGANEPNSIIFSRSASSNNLSFYGLNTNTYTVAVTSTAGEIVQNEWAIFACRYTLSSTLVEFFKNGRQTYSVASGSLNNRTSATSYIGRAELSSDSYTNIDIAALYVYDRALSNTEMTSLYSTITETVSLPSNSSSFVDLSKGNICIDSRDITNSSSGNKITTIGGFYQSAISQQPTFYSSGGLNNLPYISFNRSSSQFLQNDKLTINLTSNDGFTSSALVRFIDPNITPLFNPNLSVESYATGVGVGTIIPGCTVYDSSNVSTNGILRSPSHKGTKYFSVANGGTGRWTNINFKRNSGFLNIPTFTQNHLIVIEASFGAGFWGHGFRFGYDQNNNNIVDGNATEEGPGIFYNSQNNGIFIYAANSTNTRIDMFTPPWNKWIRFRLVFNLQDSVVSVFQKDDTVLNSVFAPVVSLTNLPLNLNWSSSTVTNPTNWDTLMLQSSSDSIAIEGLSLNVYDATSGKQFFSSSSNSFERIFDFGNGAPNNNLILSRSGTGGNLRFSIFNLNNILEFPSRELTANTTTITTGSYGTGTYIVTASSASGYPAYLAFESTTLFNGSDSFWHSNAVYNATTGVYTGANTTTTQTGTTYSGEWIQLQLPTQLVLDSFSILPRQDSNLWLNRSPGSFVLLGSNNGTSWNLIYSISGINDWTVSSKTFSVSYDKTGYTHYRLVSTIAGNSSASTIRDSIQISRLRFFGVSNANYAIDTVSSPILQNTWYHITTRYTNSSGIQELFLDNKLIGTNTSIPYLSNRTLTSNFIGRSNWSADAYTNMDLSSLYVFDKPLTNDQISKLYAYMTSSSSDLTNLANEFSKVESRELTLANDDTISSIGNFSQSNVLNRPTYKSLNNEPVQLGLIAYFDPADKSCYSGTGATMASLVGSGISGTIGGTSSFANGTIRLVNSSVYASSNSSRLQLNTLSNITTVSMWYYQHSRIPSRYLLDGRSGGSGAWIYSGGDYTGTNWTTGTLYRNDGSANSITWSNIESVGQWQMITVIANTPFTDDITLFGNEGLDVTFGPILIYDRAITESENRYNFNVIFEKYYKYSSSLITRLDSHNSPIPHISFNKIANASRTNSLNITTPTAFNIETTNGFTIISKIRMRSTNSAQEILDLSNSTTGSAVGNLSMELTTAGNLRLSSFNTPSGSDAVTAITTWTTRRSAADNGWTQVCWSPELSLFVAVADTGTGNRVMTSPDGLIWTTRASAADNGWNYVVWSSELSLFVAVAYSGSGNRVMTSSNGISWTTRITNNNNWPQICWSPELSLFVAVADTGSGNRVMTSLNGIDWITRTSAADNGWHGICWSKERGIFVAVAYSGTGNRVMTSPDGITWTTRSSAADNQWFDVCWSSELGLFVAVAASGVGNRIMTSADGITWTTRSTPADNTWYNITWCKEISLFISVAASGAGNRIMTSSDGISWISRVSPIDNNWLAGCWSPQLGIFVATASSGTSNRVMSTLPIYKGSNNISKYINFKNNSTTAVSTWTSRTTPNIAWNRIAWSSELSLFVAVGIGGCMTSSDGVIWTTRAVANNSWQGISWSPELKLFVSVANTGSGNRVMTSNDGIVWTTRNAVDNSWVSVVWSSRLRLFAAVAGSGTGNRIMTSNDGIVWTTRTSAADSDWLEITWSEELALFVAVAQVSTIRAMTSPDGITWTARTVPNSPSNTYQWNGVTWSKELSLFAAVSYGGAVMTSPDGITWTTRTVPASNGWLRICWSSELYLFVAVAAFTGAGNRVMTSSDGITWISRSSAGDINWYSIAWSPELGIFAAVSNSGTTNRVMTSTNVYDYSETKIPQNEWVTVSARYQRSDAKASLDARQLDSVLTNNRTVYDWGGFAQSTVSARPTYFNSGGYNGRSYVSFNGTNGQYLQSPNLTLNIASGGGFTALALVRFTSIISFARIFEFGNGINNDNKIYFSRYSSLDSLHFSISNVGENRSIISNSGIVENTWQVLGCRYNYSTNLMEIFIDGVQNNSVISTVSFTDRTLSSNSIANYAGTSTTGTTSIDISSLYVFDRALSDTELGRYTNNMLSTDLPLTEILDISLNGENKVTIPVVSSINSRTLVSGHIGKTNNALSYSNMDLQSMYLFNRPLTNSELAEMHTYMNETIGNPFSSNFFVKSRSKNNLENGSYLINSSSLNVTGSSPYLAFNSKTDSIETGWSSANNLYNSTTGSYIGSVSTIVDGTVYSGEWIQVQFPSSFALRNYTVSARPNFEWEAPKNFIVAGSNDNNSWTLVDSRTNQIWNLSTRTKTYTISNSKGYFYYRLICREIGSVGNYTNGANWALQNTVNNNWRSVCWSPQLSILVAVGESGSGNRVMTSPDGIAWTTRSSASDGQWMGITWSAQLSLFVAVGINCIMTSPDGIVWTSRTSPANLQWRTVIWVSQLSLFVCVAETGSSTNAVMTSPDGITWTTRTTNTNQWVSVIWSPERSLLVAISSSGTGNRVMTSPDGVAWTTRASAVDNSWKDITWSSSLGLFVAVADSGTGNRIMTSSDGTTWISRTSPADNGWGSIVWAAELSQFVAVAYSGGTGNRIMTSNDGIVWTTRTSAADNGWLCVTWAPELRLFVTVSNSGSGNRVMTSRGYTQNINAYVNKLNLSGQSNFSATQLSQTQTGEIKFSDFYNKYYIPQDGLVLLLDPKDYFGSTTWKIATINNSPVFKNNGNDPDANILFGTKVLFDENTWYNFLSRNGFSTIVSGANPDAQSWIADGSAGSNGWWSSSNVTISRFTNFIFQSEIYISPPVGYSAGDWYIYYFGDTSINGGQGIQVVFNFWSGAYNGVGVYILKNNTIVASNTSFNPGNFINAWYPVIIYFNTSSSGTWNVRFNGSDILTYNDSDVFNWRLNAGSVFSHFARSGGGLRMNAYIRRLKLNYDLENAVVPSISNVTDFTTSNNYSINTWCWMASTQNDMGDTAYEIAIKWDGNENKYPYTIRYIRSSKTIFTAAYDGTNFPSTISGSIVTNTWNFVSCTFDWTNKLLSVYINGTLSNTTALPGNMGSISNGSAVHLMQRGNNTLRTTGRLGIISIHNKALTNTEILDTFNSTRDLYTWDCASTMSVCFSVRLILSSYNGPIFRVRRSTDNAVSDFYTDSTQSYLTTGPNSTGTSYATWISGATGYVTTWYDQSGHRSNATNTAGNLTQPNIALVNSKYVLQFRSSDQTRLNITAVQPNTIFCHFYNTNTNNGTIISTEYDYQMRFGNSNGTSVNGDSNAGDWYYSGTGTKRAYNNGLSSNTVLLNAWNVFSVSVETPTWITSSTSPGTSSFNKIGADGWQGLNSVRNLNGYMTELICHNTALTNYDLQNYYSNRLLHGLLDQISSTAKNACRGAYSLFRLTSSYSGPIIQIRKNNDNSIKDFYGNFTGSLTTNLGISITNWLNGDTGYIVTWYDQSGNGNHATQNIFEFQPFFNLIVDFGSDSSRFLNIPNGTVPVGTLNAPYTFFLKHGNISNNLSGGFIGSGSTSTTSGNNLQCNLQFNYAYSNNNFNIGQVSITNPSFAQSSFKIDTRDVNQVSGTSISSIGSVSFTGTNVIYYNDFTGYNNSLPYITLSNISTLSNSSMTLNFSDGLTILVLASFYGSVVTGECIFTFSSFIPSLNSHRNIINVRRVDSSQNLIFWINNTYMNQFNQLVTDTYQLQTDSNDLIVQDEWALFGIRYNKTTNLVEIFKNGSLKKSGTSTITLTNRTVTSNFIGKYLFNYNQLNSNIKISSFYFYTRYLSDTEMSTLYNNMLISLASLSAENRLFVKFTGSLLTSYINSSKIYTLSSSGYINEAGQQYIGKTSNNEYLNGQLYNLYIFNTDLNDTDRLIIDKDSMKAFN